MYIQMYVDIYVSFYSHIHLFTFLHSWKFLSVSKHDEFL